MKITLYVILFCICLSLNAFGVGNDVRDVLEISREGYRNYLEKIPKGREALYGFKNREEFSIAEIGKVYEIFTLNKYFFSSNSLSGRDYLMPVGEWRVVITVKGEGRILLTIAKPKLSWEIVGLGAMGLVRELQEFERKYPSDDQVGLLLKVYQLSSNFILFPSNSQSSNFNVYPLATAKAVLGISDALEFTLQDALLLIKDKVDH